MKVRVTFTIDADEFIRREINVFYGKPGLATRDEVRDWFRSKGQDDGGDALSVQAYYRNDPDPDEHEDAES
jgi:hypothetical protein